MSGAFPGSYFCSARGEMLNCQSLVDAPVEECIVPVRGGGKLNNGASAFQEMDEERNRIDKFLTDNKNEASLDNFYIHGWRWHTMSLVREVGRLRDLAGRSTPTMDDRDDGDRDNDAEALKKAADYVIGFNLRGLHKIEADLFFPWMREKLTAIEKPELAGAFGSVMDELETDRKTVARLGDAIVSLTLQDIEFISIFRLFVQFLTF